MLAVGETDRSSAPARSASSVVQQPGVPHDWHNRTAENAVMVGVLLSAR